jgi:hypothetical protein
MLIAEHNGGPPMNVSQALAELPRDVIMCNWSVSTAPDSSKRLHDLGFTVFDFVNQFKPVPGDVNIISGYGSVLYSCFMQTFTSRSPENIMVGYTHAPYRTGQYAWNLKTESHLPLDEWRRKYMNSIQALYHFPARRTPALTFKPLPLDAVANYTAKEWFGQPGAAPQIPEGAATLAFTPFTFVTGDKNDVVAPRPGQEEVVIPLGMRVRTLNIVQALYLIPAKRKEFKQLGNNYFSGIPAGEVQIEYEHGATEIVPLRAGIETNEASPEPATRFMYGIKYTHDTVTAAGGRAALYVLEWANPWPARTIKRVVWRAYDPAMAVPILFSITAAY